jgi:16S rRNA (cytidine1402-2'-O)-methyltransferase
MSGKLRIVCTPIGNVEDIAPRAVEALKTSALILAEDTRHTKPLLDRLGVHAPLVSCHQHNESERAGLVAEKLEAGESVSLVSDAGAPSISDPGGRLVADVVALGHEVEVFPGPSAAIAALMGAGLVAHRFMFVGFLPKKGQKRRALVEGAVRDGAALVIYEAANRTEATLEDLAEILGPRRVVVARELTKRHETFHRGTLGGALAPSFVDKGEVVIVVEGGEEGVPSEAVDPAVLLEELRADVALSPKERAKKLAAAMSISNKEAYALLLAEPVDDAARSKPARAATASAPGLVKVRALLAEAAEAFLAADDDAQKILGPSSGSVESGIPGADALMRYLERTTAIPAPVEAKDFAKALLSALAAADALDDALAAD